MRREKQELLKWIKGKMKTLKLLGFLIALGTTLNIASASTYKPYVAQNGTYRGQINTKTYRPKDTYVKPYVHKDGSRVRSHYRSRSKR